MLRADLSPRAARTRSALIAAGFDLLAERPVDAIPIDDVVTLAGVAKGSFFNHFADKTAFAAALATDVRLDLEAQVTRANHGVTDPVARIAGGMRTGANYALANPKRTLVLLRSLTGATSRAHPLNQGLVDDIAAARQQGQIAPEAGELGVLYWLGLCQALMANLVERQPEPAAAERRIAAMVLLGLTGLGVDRAHAARVAAITA